MTRIYTFVNQKGGVGKTTSVINLGAYFAIYGQKVLIVDLDPQANASSSLGMDKAQVKNGTYEVLIGNIPPAAAILHHRLFNLSILPSSPALAGAEVELLDMTQREFRLKETLEQISAGYDYLLIDCPPSLSILTVNGLVAAKDGVLIPVQCEYLALEGIGQLTLTIKRVQSALFPDLKVRGVLLTMYDGRTTLAADVVNEVRKYFQAQVFSTIIPRSIRLAEAPSYGKPIAFYSPSSAGARCYSALAREILTQDGIQVPAETQPEVKEHGT